MFTDGKYFVTIAAIPPKVITRRILIWPHCFLSPTFDIAAVAMIKRFAVCGSGKCILTVAMGNVIWVFGAGNCILTVAEGNPVCICRLLMILIFIFYCS
jgi:hypothetical protein